MGYALVTPPAIEPVSLEEAKLHCRIDGASEDALITALIQAAREAIENLTGRSLITQTWRADFWRFPCAGYALRLPHGPVQAVEDIEYYADDGSDETLDPGVYKVDLTEQTAKVWLAPDQAWPALQMQPDAVRVTFTAGFGDAAADVPQALRQAMLLLIGQWYDTRTSIPTVSSSVIPELPFAVSALIASHTVRSVA